MKTRTALYFGIGLTLATLAYSLLLYPSLPDRIPTHWNMSGQVDDWGEKTWAAFFGPALTALFTLMLVVLPAISPRNFSVEPFRETFNYIFVIVLGLFGYLHAVMLQSALHPGLDSGKVLVSGLFLFLALMGNVLGRVRRNFWVGVRTPWTLASERVWNATHRLAAHLMVAAGLFGAVAVWLGAPVWACLVTLIAALTAPVFHSLYLYKRWEREEPQG